MPPVNNTFHLKEWSSPRHFVLRQVCAKARLQYRRPYTILSGKWYGKRQYHDRDEAAYYFGDADGNLLSR